MRITLRTTRRTRRVAIATALSLAGSTAWGCATHGSGTPKPSASETRSAIAPCAGTPYVDVTNRAEASVDVYAYRSSGVRQYLGTVGPGNQRLAGFEDMGFVYAEVGGQRVTGSMASRGEAGSISFTRGCDTGN